MQESLESWIGRTQEIRDRTATGPLERLAALLDHETPPWPSGVVPPLGHWLYFLPHDRQSELGADGHARRGGFLPPVALPRRMWAGSRITFHAPLPLETDVMRRSTIENVEEKAGRSGRLVFVTVRHEIFASGEPVLTDCHDLVFREAPGKEPAAPPRGEPAPAAGISMSRAVTPDPVMLFRYSALTFNGHRIHYDHDYVRNVEGYPGLVVHGPLTATLLLDLYSRHRPDAVVSAFEFRGVSPLFDTGSFMLLGVERDDGADLYAVDGGGHVAMKARLTAQ